MRSGQRKTFAEFNQLFLPGASTPRRVIRCLLEEKTIAVSITAQGWLRCGAISLAVQSMIFVSAVAKFGEATMANILYSSWGLWSVVAVWLIGHWFRSREQHLPAKMLALRFSGAFLLLIAIGLVVASRR